MATLAEDVSFLHNILLENGVDQTVDQEMVRALLELYAADSQRVDLVLLELEGMLGQQFKVGTQLQRWEELKSSNELIKEIQIQCTKKADDDKHLEAIFRKETNHHIVSHSCSSPSKIMKKSNLKTPKTFFPSGPSTSELSPLLNLSSRANKDKITSNIPALSNEITHHLTVPLNKTQAKPFKRPHKEFQSYHLSEAENVNKSVNEFAPPNNKRAFIGGPINSGHPSQIPSGLHGVPSGNSEKTLQEKSVEYYQSILNHAPNLHIKFVAFKAAEIALNNGAFQVNELVSEWTNNNQLLKANLPWDVPETATTEHLQLYQYVFERHLTEQLEFIVLTVPDADPEYLEDMVRQYQGDQEKIRNFVAELIECRTYPSRAEYNKRKAYNEIANKFFSVEEFLELYEDPFQHFSDESKVTDQEYREEALNQLKTDFRFAGVVHIRKVFQKHNFHYVPAYNELACSQDSNQRKTKRSLQECLRNKTKSLSLIEEVAFTRIASDLNAFQESRKQLRNDALAVARTCGTLLDCPICCEDELIEDDFVQCPLNHQICRKCVRRQSEELIGLMKNHVCCLMQDCSAEYSLLTLKEVLGKLVYGRLEKRRQAEEILAAGIEGLESCPFCEYCEVPRDSDRLFECQNPECGKVSCRHCRETNHLPLRCEEHSMKMKLRNYVETKMTDALLRECPSCKRRFIKSEGCNKMTCVCGTKMCYVCRMEIKDYHHFANGGPQENEPAEKKCPLYSDTVKLHETEVARGATRAHQDLKSRNPHIRVDLVLADK